MQKLNPDGEVWPTTPTTPSWGRDWHSRSLSLVCAGAGVCGEFYFLLLFTITPQIALSQHAARMQQSSRIRKLPAVRLINSMRDAWPPVVGVPTGRMAGRYNPPPAGLRYTGVVINLSSSNNNAPRIACPCAAACSGKRGTGGEGKAVQMGML